VLIAYTRSVRRKSRLFAPGLGIFIPFDEFGLVLSLGVVIFYGFIQK
jgi:hypothetical protein